MSGTVTTGTTATTSSSVTTGSTTVTTTITTTLVTFAPSAAAAFQFNAQFDGGAYVCSIIWNAWAQRWYLAILDTSNTLIVCRALISCLESSPINLLFGYFTESVMYFYDDNQQFQIVTTVITTTTT